MVFVFTLLVMALVGYMYFREGVFTAFTMCVNVIVAGLVTFNFWEPLSDLIGKALPPALQNYLDFVLMIAMFSLILGILRLVTNNMANRQIDYHPALLQFGG